METTTLIICSTIVVLIAISQHYHLKRYKHKKLLEIAQENRKAEKLQNERLKLQAKLSKEARYWADKTPTEQNRAITTTAISHGIAHLFTRHLH